MTITIDEEEIYNEEVPYSKDDIVSDSDKVYIALENNKNSPPSSNPLKWKLLGDHKASGSSGGGNADIVEKSSTSLFPSTGESKKLYIDTTNNVIYRWDSDKNNYFSIGDKLSSSEVGIETEDLINGGGA